MFPSVLASCVAQANNNAYPDGYMEPTQDKLVCSVGKPDIKPEGAVESAAVPVAWDVELRLAREQQAVRHAKAKVPIPRGN